MYKLRGVGCMGNPPCQGCKSYAGFGVDQTGHSDIEQDRALIAAAVQDAMMKQTFLFAAIVLGGMYVIEKYAGR